MSFTFLRDICSEACTEVAIANSYATNDTIEAKILHAAVRQGTSNYVKYDSDTSYAVASGVAKRGGDDFSGR